MLVCEDEIDKTNEPKSERKTKKGDSMDKVSEDRCLIPEACKFVSMCVKVTEHLGFISHLACVYWVSKHGDLHLF